MPPDEDRRGPNRLPDPLCPQCQGALVRVTARTAHVVGYRCRACDETWNVPKPELPAGDSQDAIDPAPAHRGPIAR